MDNLGSHKGTAVRKAVFLPPYSPDLNPIEQVFAKLKLLLRKAPTYPEDGRYVTIGAWGLAVRHRLTACPRGTPPLLHHGFVSGPASSTSFAAIALNSGAGSFEVSRS